jgi:glutamine synthetase
MHNQVSKKLLNDLSNKIDSSKIISFLQNKLSNLHNIDLTFGAEIEFYANKSLDQHKLNFIKERGENQYEFHVGVIEDPEIFMLKLNSEILRIKHILTLDNIEADFSPKPFSADYGNALQIQFSSTSKNFQDNIDKICSYFCSKTLEIYYGFSPKAEDYKRFNSKFMAPTHISYGYNNRSCLYRVSGYKDKRRVELRQPSINSNIKIIIATIYIFLLESLNKDDIVIFPVTYGNAFDTQYNLKKLPKNISEAKNLFNIELYEKYFKKISHEI